MINLTLIAALLVDLNLTPLLERSANAPDGLVCEIATVAVRFTGTPGEAFRFERRRYVVPDEGVIELIVVSQKTKTYQYRGKTYSLAGPLDPFRIRTVELGGTGRNDER